MSRSSSAAALLHEAGAVVLAALVSSLLIAFLLVAVETIQNGYVAANLFRLPLFAIADTFEALFLPALWLSVFVSSASFLLTLLRFMGRRAQWTLLALATGFGTLLAVCGAELREMFWAACKYGLPRFFLRQWLGVVRQDITTWLAILLILATCRVLHLRNRQPRFGFRRYGALISVVVIASMVVGTARLLRIRTHTTYSGRKSIVLIVLDTVAANHMASYGYHRVTTPELDRLATRGIQFTRSYSVAPWTLPAHASMFTGLYPLQHGATQENLQLHSRFRTVAEILRNEGYRTLAVVNNPVLSASSKIDRGFAEYVPMWRESFEVSFAADGGDPTNRAVTRFLDTVSAGESIFIFLNYIEAHSPYDPPREFRGRFLADESAAPRVNQSWQEYYTGRNPLGPQEFALLRDLYDAELAYLSRTIGELMEGIEKRGLLKDTIVIITSDHGENLGDHGHLDHVFNLYNSVLRVPLIILDGENVQGRSDEGFAASVDIFKTMLGAAKSRYQSRGAGGRDLLKPRQDEGAPVVHIAEYYYPKQVLSVIGSEWVARAAGSLRPYLRRIRSLQTREWKVIWGSDGKSELYNVERDPNEEVDVSEREPERVKALTALLEGRLRELSGGDFSFEREHISSGVDGFKGLDRETVEKLRALGYVQ